MRVPWHTYNSVLSDREEVRLRPRYFLDSEALQTGDALEALRRAVRAHAWPEAQWTLLETDWHAAPSPAHQVALFIDVGALVYDMRLEERLQALPYQPSAWCCPLVCEQKRSSR